MDFVFLENLLNLIFWCQLFETFFQILSNFSEDLWQEVALVAQSCPRSGMELYIGVQYVQRPGTAKLHLISLQMHLNFGAEAINNPKF